MNLIKWTRWTAAHAAWLTMAFSPVALGLEAEKLSKQKVAQYIQEFGLNKKTTLGEFWEKSKAYYPGYIYKELEEFVQQNRNLQMPEIAVSASMGSDGIEIPTLQLSQNGRSNSIQIFGEKKRWAKFNNAVLSQVDMERPHDLFTRVQANDIRIKNEADLLKKKSQSVVDLQSKKQSQQNIDLSRFQGLPRMTPQSWKSMTPIQRAGFIVNMRLLWRDARGVLAAKPNASQGGKKTSSIENFYKAVFGEVAFAQSETGDLPTSNRSTNSEKSQVPAKVSKAYTLATKGNRPTCLVAGFATGSYAQVANASGPNRDGCSYENATRSYDKNPIFTSAKAKCQDQGATWVPCNPLIYSYKSNGDPTCMNKVEKDFLMATHWEKDCDNSNKSTSDIAQIGKLQKEDDLKKEFLAKNKRSDNNSDQQISDIEKQQRSASESESYQQTKAFLDGALKAAQGGDSKGGDLNSVLNGLWTEEIDNKLVAIQINFEKEINNAIASCEKFTNDPRQKDPLQAGACNQLHRRWLFTERFIAKYREKACVGGTYNWKFKKDEASYDSATGAESYKAKINKSTVKDIQEKNPQSANQMCTCDGSKVKQPLGQACLQSAPLGLGEVVPPGSVATVEAKGCPSGTSRLAGPVTNQCACDSNDKKMISESTPKEDVKKLCADNDLWKWALGGLGLLALFALFNRHKKPNAIPPTQPPLCGENKVISGNTCICASSCANGQIPNPTSCACAVEPPQPVCPSPKVGTPPACSCPGSNSCATNQQIFDNVSCQCTNVSQPVICPDGSTAPKTPSEPLGSLAGCPKCSNGTFAPKGGCPAANEGGAGNNCPTGNCNGGAPTKR